VSNRTAYSTVLIALFWAIGLFGQTTAPASEQSALKVNVNYSGKGAVDQRHKLYVLLADANPYTASALIDSSSDPKPPSPEAGVCHILASGSISDRHGVVTFRHVSIPTVYAVAFFDEFGTYNGQLDSLPPGTSMGAYGIAPDKLEAIKIEQGKTAEITLAFANSSKTP
jgi:hypothetical protein